MVTYATEGKESRGRDALKGTKRAMLLGPDLSQQSLAESFLTWTEHESARKGHVGQKSKATEVKPSFSCFSVSAMNTAMLFSAETAGGQRAECKGMLE